MTHLVEIQLGFIGIIWIGNNLNWSTHVKLNMSCIFLLIEFNFVLLRYLVLKPISPWWSSQSFLFASTCIMPMACLNVIMLLYFLRVIIYIYCSHLVPFTMMKPHVAVSFVHGKHKVDLKKFFFGYWLGSDIITEFSKYIKYPPPSLFYDQILLLDFRSTLSILPFLSLKRPRY